MFSYVYFRLYKNLSYGTDTLRLDVLFKKFVEETHSLQSKNSFAKYVSRAFPEAGPKTCQQNGKRGREHAEKESTLDLLCDIRLTNFQLPFWRYWFLVSSSSGPLYGNSCLRLLCVVGSHRGIYLKLGSLHQLIMNASKCSRHKTWPRNAPRLTSKTYYWNFTSGMTW